ncbi:Golgi-associated RAB2 interactor protein 6-like [Acinonyx jubatus]|uniref:Golgi-associated RAB2 interactor protein 6-like n=1 Tax=Acinonyx jubatus TaxID=32536 RepID=A0ABM3PQD8_ACIJB|nr:Golgi-associated RAB2 interactor protein 6-like [Acinonyx jubatus]
MDSDLKLLCDGSRSFQMLHMFNKSVGKLQGLLCKGEYALLKHLLIFESDFIQINKRGEVIDVHNSVQMVTVGIAYTSQNLTIPDIVLLAQPAVSYAVSARNDQDTHGKGFKSTKSLELTRYPSTIKKKKVPLEACHWTLFLPTIVHPPDAKEDLFACWEDLVYLRRPPVEAYSGTLAQPAGNIISIPVLEGENKKKPACCNALNSIPAVQCILER